MKVVNWLLYLYITVVLGKYAVAQDHQQECEVGGDGSCLNAERSATTVQETTETTEVKIADEPAIEIDKNCPDRGHIIRCTGAHLDLNKNGKLDRDELDNAIQSLPWYARGIVKLLGNTDKMMKKCDMDHDDAISMDYDMLHNEDTCLATCFKRKAFKQTFFADCSL